MPDDEHTPNCRQLYPTPDLRVDVCRDCHRRTRVFQWWNDWLCRSCYRDMVIAVLETKDEGSPDE